MSVEKSIAIPEDSKASIVSLDLLGTKAIQLSPGKSTNLIKDKETMIGSVEVGMIDQLGAAATPAIETAKNTMASLDKTIQQINEILDEETQRNLKSTVSNLNQTMISFNQFANELNGQRQKISSLIENLNAFATNLNKNNNTITRVLQNAETTTGNLSKLDLESTINELKSTLEGMQTTLNKMNNGNGSLALLMNDDKLYKNLKNTLATANNLLYDINARPSRYINVNVFGKKQKNECPPQPAPNAND
jgi:phospholipid/cholesterol/gamma-HCH transport system substrate-binding protein